MATLKLKVNDQILGQFLKLLKRFKVEDVEIIDSDSQFIKDQTHVQHEIARVKSGEAKLYTLEEADAIFEETIKQYESPSDR
tara:strand:+ start:91 stop:336 length:246 start_codon:yes stop_codon:yes gene_type:complete